MATDFIARLRRSRQEMTEEPVRLRVPQSWIGGGSAELAPADEPQAEPADSQATQAATVSHSDPADSQATQAATEHDLIDSAQAVYREARAKHRKEKEQQVQGCLKNALKKGKGCGRAIEPKNGRAQEPRRHGRAGASTATEI